MAEREKPPIKIYGNDALSSRVAAFQRRASEPIKLKKTDPFFKTAFRNLKPHKWSDDGCLVENPGTEYGDWAGADMGDKTESMAHSSVKIYGNDSLSSRVAALQKRADEHQKKQKANPFSQAGGANMLDRPKWDKNDPRYGRPVEGSKTEKRGLAAGAHIGNEVQYLCSIISEFGVPCEDGSTVISFGELFEIYSRISNKVVGILLRARKHGLVYFEGEMLFQRRDDHVIISLLKPMAELREEWGVKPPAEPTKKEAEED